MTSAPSIRHLEPADEGLYRGLWLEALRDYAPYFRIAAEDDSVLPIPTRFARDSFTLGAFYGQRLVGILSLNRETGAKLRHKALLFRMFVHPDAAGRGTGRSLLREAITQAESVGDLRQLHLTVLATNQKAWGLYRSMGFVEFALERESVLIGDQYVDEVQMARFLGGRGRRL